MAFYVGQKVVCVETGPITNEIGSTHAAHQLTIGCVYTIKEIVAQGRGLVLVEARNKPGCNGFNARRFRPAVERKTDISALKALLNTVPEKVSA